MPKFLLDEYILILEPILDDYKDKKSETDKNARICLSYFKVHNPKENLNFVKSCLKKYQECEYFHEINECYLGFLNKYDEAILICNEGLKLFPKSIRLTYDKAVHLRIINKDGAIATYEDFMKLIEKDHRKFPEAYYSIGICLINLFNKSLDDKKESKTNVFEKAREYYNLGLNAEKLQLPFFLPYKSSSKDFLDQYLTSYDKIVKKENDGNLQKKMNNIIIDAKNTVELNKQNKTYELSNFKIKCITKHRSNLIIFSKIRPDMKKQTSTLGPLKTNVEKLQNLKRIYLRDMDHTLDQIYKGYELIALIADIPNFGLNAVGFILEDENRDNEILYVYFNDKNEDKINKDFSVGTKISISNPYMRMAIDGFPCVRVDNDGDIKILEQRKNVCRTCLKDNCKFSCSICKKAYYCSKECQNMDWKQLDHKTICSKLK